VTIYTQLGGETGVRQLVDRFYDLMDELPTASTVRNMHASDLSSSRDKLFKFLSGFLGGPSLYIQEYGHPMLRARHLPFAIGDDERDQWMHCMSLALDDVVKDPQLHAQLKSYFAHTADHMRNQEKR
jgi:hemoglobin